MILCAAAVLSALYVIRLKGSDAFSDNFRPSYLLCRAVPLYLLCIWIYRKRELGLIVRK